MSWVYCDPKSRMRIFSEWMSTEPLPSAGRALVRPVVRRFLLDDHVVDVALLEPRRGDADEARLHPELRDRLAAEVAHAAAEPAHELEDGHLDGALVRHAPLDALRDELVGVGHVRLEVAVLRPLLHGAEGAHAAVLLVAAALVEDHLARRLLGAGHERADHDRGGAR